MHRKLSTIYDMNTPVTGVIDFSPLAHLADPKVPRKDAFLHAAGIKTLKSKNLKKSLVAKALDWRKNR